MKAYKAAIFISGRGSNMEALLKAEKEGRIPNVEFSLVVADKENAKGLAKAKEYGKEGLYIDCSEYKSKLDGKAQDKVIEELKKRKIDLICLAGFMRMLKSKLIREYENRIINIHPSLLPEFPGLKAQKQAVEASVKVSGATVHFVDEGMDSGPIIAQRRVELAKGEDERSLSAKILKEEHKLYPEVLAKIGKGELKIGK